MLTRAEIDEMLRRTDLQRCRLRRATRELASLGQQLIDARDATRRRMALDLDNPEDADVLGRSRAVNLR
ncbi:MAG TPA: hypothetical protein VGF94_18400 [Kofleriaceae bacterium]